MKQIGLSVAVFLSMVACATTYHSKGLTGGFSEQVLAEDKYIVNFSGNAYLSSSRAEMYLLRRCAELTLEKGFDFFVQLQMNAHVRQEPAGVLLGGGSISKPDFTATIELGHGQGPKGSYDARELLKNICPSFASEAPCDAKLLRSGPSK